MGVPVLLKVPRTPPGHLALHLRSSSLHPLPHSRARKVLEPRTGERGWGGQGSNTGREEVEEGQAPTLSPRQEG